MLAKTETVTLSEIQKRIKNTLESALAENYWVTAEISELKTNASGHCYVELVEKDADAKTLKAKISATIWAYSYRMLKPYFETATGRVLEAGIRVLVKVSIQYHALYGLSLSISDIDPAYTVGEMEMQRRKTIAQLKNDGVFNMNHELPVPILPQRIAIISSKQAAGYQDFMKHLFCNEYGFAFYTYLFPSLVQGNGAVKSITDNLALINAQRELFDVVVIIRGGGSTADLACFDEYELGWHVAQFPLPILSGVGHDKDKSIVDMVAHSAFKTPTAVADFLIDCMAEQENRLNKQEQVMTQIVQYIVVSEKNHMESVSARLNVAVKLYFQKMQFRMQLIEKEIQNKNPETILARGYSIVSLNNKAICSAQQVQADNKLLITLHKGKIMATASEIIDI